MNCVWVDRYFSKDYSVRGADPKEANMPERRVLVVGNLPATLQIGQQVLTTRGYVEAIETLKTTDFDVIIIPAVCGTTNGHGFLQKIRDINEQRKRKKQTPIAILVHHDNDRLEVVVAGKQRPWNLEPSMCSFGNSTFVNTSIPGWEYVVVDWLREPRRITRNAA